MVFPTRIHCRVSKLSQMIAQLNNFFVFPSVTSEKHFPTPSPSSSSVKFPVFFSTNLVPNPELSASASIQSRSHLFGNHGSRTAITQAQKVLFDYLHSTRNFCFSDAEHMSKHSPLFTQKLLSEIENEEDVARSLGKFLRYNPINEFEPFFESLGLRPSDVSSLLPQHLNFLSDDPLLLENYSVLCNYGIPRCKIGKIYKEAREIFGTELGSLYLKLRAYENLGLSRGVVIKLTISCPSLLIGDIDKDFINVLEKLTGFGIDSDQFGGCLSSKFSYNWKKILATMNFLNKVGYSDEQLCILFKENPQSVLEDSGKRVHALFNRLHELGLNQNEVSSFFKKNPKLLSAKCVKNLLRALEIFEDIGLETEEVADIVSRHIEFLCLCYLKAGKTVCSELKIKKVTLREIIRQDPSKFFSSASKNQLESSEYLLFGEQKTTMDRTAFLLRLGYLENSDEILRASKMFRGRADQLQERFDCLVEAGLDSRTVSSLIKQVPMALNLTKDVIQMKIDCLKNCFPLSSLMTFPAYLCYDIKRINHRFAMYVWLKDRGAVNPKLSLGTILACSDKRFMKYFVDIHPDGPVVWERLRSASS